MQGATQQSLPTSSKLKTSVHLYGATVTAFYAAQEPERNVLFLSEKALLDGSKPIRGGIPLVFPVFGAAEGFPNHDFARVNHWKLSQLDQTVGDDNSPTVATFSLDVTDEMKAMYPHDFALVYEVKLFANALATAIHIQSKSEGEIAFQVMDAAHVLVMSVLEVSLWKVLKA
ncbi:unnamed protein product [Phytophthora lilii]|uniref:Unnamed protein product n=1 Tax=Phytophthora lilii TaxID=2077276 RepID=A0A9W6WQQ1_9STRA|nr:unnamed protein product [Phytophthora lilii]